MYIQEQTVYPEIDDNYIAVAVNKRTFEQLLSARSVHISAKDVFITGPLFITFIMFITLVIVLVLGVVRGTFGHGELNRQGKDYYE